MGMNWFESILFGILAGLTDILPVSAQAHRILMLKFFGKAASPDLMNLLVRIGILAALYLSCQSQIIRMRRAHALTRIPKRKRKRPLDTRSLMDLSMVKTMLLPVVLGLFVYQYTGKLRSNMMLIALFLLINGVILYVPQFFPSSNRDARTLSRVEGLLMGLGGAVSILPGISAVGAATSVGSVCGVERGYCLNMALIMNLVLAAGFLVYDIVGIVGNGVGTLSFLIMLQYLLAGVAAFAGTMLGIKLMRQLAANNGYASIAFYCIGLALFTFILNLMA